MTLLLPNETSLAVDDRGLMAADRAVWRFLSEGESPDGIPVHPDGVDAPRITEPRGSLQDLASGFKRLFGEEALHRQPRSAVVLPGAGCSAAELLDGEGEVRGYWSALYVKLNGQWHLTHLHLSVTEASERAEIERLRASLRDTQERLLQQEKMASLGSLTAGIAHEIRNPLNFVNNFADAAAELIEEMRQEVTGGDPRTLEELLHEAQSSVEKIAEHGRRAESVVRSMLAHGRSDGRFEPVDVNQLVQEYVTLAYHGLRARASDFQCRIRMDLAEDVPTAILIREDIGRVILNLAANAFQAMREKWGEDATGDAGPVLVVSTEATAERATIRLRDNGPGIADEMREHLFEPFFSTKPVSEGTGLGLAISREIIEVVHKGSIHMDTVPGEYCEFVLHLPLTRADIGTAVPTDPQA
jgi:signal transduction histidine kinase